MTKKYNEEFDAYYNADTDKWLEAKCCTTDETGCYFKCHERPEKPSQTKEGK